MAGPLPPGVPRKRPNNAHTKHARNTHNTAGPPHRNTQQLNAITNHRSKFKKLQLLIGTGARTDGGTDTHKSLRPTLATEESSRARSFARSHARTQRKRKRNRNRFPGSGVGLKSLSHPQPPILVYDRMIRMESKPCGVSNCLKIPYCKW